MKNSLNLCLAILFLVVLGCSCPKLADLAKEKAPAQPDSSRSTNTASNTAPSSTSGEYVVTMAKYEQLDVGMPRADVERILGGKGTEISNSTGGGVRFTVNKWEGDNYKAIILTFRNDKIMTKTQVGL